MIAHGMLSIRSIDIRISRICRKIERNPEKLEVIRAV
jgi:hypothetical protein